MNEKAASEDKCGTKTRPSLLDPAAIGGKTALDGFDFQRRYALIWLIESLADPEFAAILVEGAEDVEARFDREGGVERHAVQVKNYRVTAAKAKEIIHHFQDRLDKASPGTWTSFAIACAELDKTVATIHNQLQNYRSKSTGEFYSETDGVLANTRDQLKQRINSAGLPPEFVTERLAFEPDLKMYSQDEWVESRALDLLQGLYPQIDHHGAQVIYLQLCNLVSGSTGKALTRHQVERAIQAELDRYAYGERSKPSGMPFMQAPQLPPKYVKRPAELKRLKEALLSSESGDAVPTTRAILHGMAAVGKSVLAAAFAHDKTVQNVFPDGVLWVTLGTDPDLPQRLADWGRALDDPSALTSPYPDAQAGTSQLRTLLRDKACLLVVDDVWEKAHIEPFLVGGSQSLLLVTSRKADVLSDATVIKLDEMREKEALKLMANWAGGIAPEDQAIAAGLAKDLGYLPLAMELAGAQVKEVGGWQAVCQLWEEEKLAAIDRGWDPDSPQDSLGISVGLSWRALHKSAQLPYLQLSIFPEDRPFPSRVAAALWGCSEARANKLLYYLVAQAMLTPRHVEGARWYILHDVLYDFAAERLGEEGRVEAHTALVAGYRQRCDGVWAKLEPDGYVHDHLAWHLSEAGLREELYTLIDKPWMDARLKLSGSRHTFASDVEWAIAAAQGPPTEWVPLARSCFVFATLGNVPSDFLGAMAQIGQTDRALGYAALTRNSDDRYRAYRMIGEVFLEQDEREKARDAFSRALEAALTIGQDNSKLEALRSLVQNLAHVGDREGLRQAMDAAIGMEATLDRESAVHEMAKAVAEIGDREDVRQALTAIMPVGRLADSRLEALSAVVQAMAQFGDRVGLGRALGAAQGTEPEGRKAEALIIVATAQNQAGMAGEAAHLAAQVLDARTDTDSDDLEVDVLCRVTKTLFQGGLEDEAIQAAHQALAAAERLGDEYAVTAAFREISQALSEIGDAEGLRAALVAARDLEDAWFKAKALTSVSQALIEVGMANEANQAASEALATATSLVREPALNAMVLSHLAQAKVQLELKEEAAQLARQAIKLAETIPGEYDRLRALDSLVEVLAPVDDEAVSQLLVPHGREPDSVQANAQAELSQLLAEAQTPIDNRGYALFLWYVASDLAELGDEAGVRQAFAMAEGIEDDRLRAEGLGRMAPILARAGLEREALQAARQAWSLVRELGDWKQKVSALSQIALAMAQMSQLNEAVEATREALASLAKAEDDWIKADVLTTLSRAMTLIEDHRGLDQVLKAVEALPDGEDKASTLIDLAEALIQVQMVDAAVQASEQALVAVQAIEYEHQMAFVFGKLAPILVQLDMHTGLERMLIEAKAMSGDRTRAEVLGQMAPILAQAGMREETEETVEQAMFSLKAIEDSWTGTYLEVLGDLIPIMVQAEMLDEARQVCGLALAKAQSLADHEGRSKKLERLAQILAQAKLKDRATQAIELALTAAEQVGEEEERIGRLANLSYALAQAGMLGEAEQAASRTLQAVDAVENQQSKLEHWSTLAEGWHKDGLNEAAARAAGLALTAIEAGGVDPAINLDSLAPALAQACDRDGLRRALAAANEIENARSRALTLVSLAQPLVQAGMVNEAAAAVNQALMTVELVEKGHEPERAQMQCEMAKALIQVGAPNRAALMVWDALASAAELEFVLDSSHVLGNVILALAQVGERELLEQAWAVAEVSDVEYDYERERKASVFGQLAQAFAQIGRAAEAAEAAKSALAIAEAMENEYSQAKTLSSVAQVLVEAGMLAEATRATQGALRAIDKLDDEWIRGETLCEVAPALARIGDVAGLEQVQVDAEALNEEEHKASALSGIALAQAMVGDQTGLVQTHREIRKLGYHKLRVDRLCLIAQALAQVGMEAQATSVAREALALSGAFGDERHRANNLRAVIQVFAQMGDSAGLQEAWAIADSIEHKMYKAEALSAVTQALSQVAEHEQAAHCLRQALVEGRGAGRSFVFQSLGCGAVTLATIDEGETLWGVHETILEMDNWWG
jgi:tetratricopeptide (TPR) repeat protein